MLCNNEFSVNFWGHALHQLQPFHAGFFNNLGLNLQSIFNIDQLPPEILARLDMPVEKYRQLILIGHGGTTMWQSLKASGIQSENPINDFSIQSVEHYFAEHLPDTDYAVVYPGDHPVGLQALGKLAGWHHASPFMVGINEVWGTWYAYRAVVLADTDFEPTVPVQSVSPCNGCQDKICIAECPAGAAGDVFDLQKCIAYRKQPASKCSATCLARVSCPVGGAHRYSDEQIQYHYAISMKTIEQKY